MFKSWATLIEIIFTAYLMFGAYLVVSGQASVVPWPPSIANAKVVLLPLIVIVALLYTGARRVVYAQTFLVSVQCYVCGPLLPR